LPGLNGGGAAAAVPPGNEAIQGAHLPGVWGTEVPVPSGVQGQIPGRGGHEVHQKLKSFIARPKLHKFWWSRERI